MTIAEGEEATVTIRQENDVVGQIRNETFMERPNINDIGFPARSIFSRIISVLFVYSLFSSFVSWS